MAIYRRNKKHSIKKYTVCEFEEFEGNTIAKQYLSDVKPVDFDKVKYNTFPFLVLDLMEGFEIARQMSEENRMYDYGEMFEKENANTTLQENKTTFSLEVMKQMTTESLNDLRVVREEAGDYENAAILRDEIERRKDEK